MIATVVGASGSGKSRFAEKLARALAGDGPLYYLATMIPTDGEDLLRIERHRTMRAGLGAITIERPDSLPLMELPRDAKDAVILLDSVTALVTNEMFSKQNADLSAKEAGAAAEKRAREGLEFIAANFQDAVFVGDLTDSDGQIYGDYTREWMRALALVLRSAAERSDLVYEAVLGLPRLIKGGEGSKE